LKAELKCGGKAVDAALDRAVENIVSDADAESAEKRRSDFVAEDEIGTVLGGEATGHTLTGGGIQIHRAFDGDLTTLKLKTGKTLKSDEDGAVVAWLRLNEFGNHGAQLGFIQLAIGLAKAEQTTARVCGDFGNLHVFGREWKGRGLAFDLGERVFIDALLVVGGEHLARDL